MVRKQRVPLSMHRMLARIRKETEMADIWMCVLMQARMQTLLKSPSIQLCILYSSTTPLPHFDDVWVYLHVSYLSGASRWPLLTV